MKNEAFINGGEEVVEIMTEQIKRIQNGKGIPKEWRSRIIKPIYKYGDKSKVENYSLNIDEYRIHDICRMVKREIAEGARKKGSFKQNTIWIQKRERDCRGNICTNRNNKRKQEKKKEKAIWERLREKKVEEKIIRILEEVHDETYAKIMIEWEAG